MADVRSFSPTQGDTDPYLAALVVDDHLHNRLMMRTLLRGFGCSIHSASSGELAIGLAKRLSFDLVIVDFNLGRGLSGDEVARGLRKSPASRSAAIFRWTTDAPTALDSALYDGQLDKPVDVRQVAEAVAFAASRARDPDRVAAEGLSSVAEAILRLR
jgi:CheY-like chemotaxis protein